MKKPKVWIRAARVWARKKGRKLLYKRWVREVLYKLYNVALPGHKGVPIYHVLSYFVTSSFNASLTQRAKGLAYSFIAAIPPLMIFIFSLIAFLPFDGIQNELLTGLADIIPEKIFTPISNTINDVMGRKHSTLLSIGFIGSIIMAANGMNGFIISLNFANHSIEKRPFLQRFLICIALVFVLYILLVLVLLLLIGHKHVMWYFLIHDIIPLSTFGSIVFHTGRWLLLTLATLTAFSLIYYWAPVKKQRISFFSPGAILATGMFFLLTWGFSVYIDNFSRYNLLYGSIGTLLLLMIWIYFSCIVLLVGYELNISIYNGTLRGKSRKSKRELKGRIQIFNNDHTEKPRKSGAERRHHKRKV
jgi:membrane protein